MPRPPGVQITRNHRKDGSTTYALRVRIQGIDERVPLGNTEDGWAEMRADQARKQLLAKIELGQWAPRPVGASVSGDEEPTFRELATDWLEARRLNPAIRPRTVQFNRTQLARYLAPFFGELRPSEITVLKIKEYRHRIHAENEQIRKAAEAGRPLRDPRTRHRIRTISNDSINQTLRTLALVLDDAEDAGWIERNPARARRTREPAERRPHRGVLDVDEFLDLLEAARQVDGFHKPATVEKANAARALRDQAKLDWKRIGAHLGVAPTTAIYLYGCAGDQPTLGRSPRRAIIATLGLAGLRVGELCGLDNRDIDLAKARLHITDAKTAAGVRAIDIHPRLLDELATYRASWPDAAPDDPAFPTRAATRRTRLNVLTHVVHPALARANELRAQRDQRPIRAHLTPHTFRRSYISFMVAAGYDLPHIQAQVGHRDPSTTLAIYAQVIARPDRDELRAEIRQLLGVDATPAAPTARPAAAARPHQLDISGLRLAAEKAGKGRTLLP
jgi:integrase